MSSKNNDGKSPDSKKHVHFKEGAAKEANEAADDHDFAEDDYEGEEGEKGTFINITVPPDAEPGVDSLTFEYAGTAMEILVPLGSVAGDVLRIQIGQIGTSDGTTGVDADAEEEEEEEVQNEKCASGGSGGEGGLLAALGGMKDENSKEVENESMENRTREVAMTSREGITIVPLGDGVVCRTTTELKMDMATTTESNKCKEKDELKNGEAEESPSRVALHLMESLPADDTLTSSSSNEGDGTHAMVWPAGRVLAEALTSKAGVQFLTKSLLQLNIEKKMREEPLHCLELGSGLGVCGLALAHSLNSYFGTDTTVSSAGSSDDSNNDDKNKSSGAIDDAISIVLTDQGERAAQLIRHNIQKNCIPSSRIRITAEPLAWGSSLCPKTYPNSKFDLILGSDLLYNTQETYDPLLHTIQTHLNPDKGIVLLAVRWRKPDLERSFFQKADVLGLKFELCGDLFQNSNLSSRCPCLLDWREYGDPSCEASNKFFRKTFVSTTKKESGGGGNGEDLAGTNISLGGVRKALADIDEVDMENMNDEQHDIFEELQIQLYVGRFVGKSEKTSSVNADEENSRKRAKHST